MKKKILILSTMCLLLSGISAQVTIGSGEKPLSGALLDLKERADGTADKGLGLPRVELTKLDPATPAELAASIGATGSWDKDKHIGLLVYNAKKNGSICPGIHIWDGTTWVPIGGGGSKPDITMTDGDGNVYAAKWFSADPCDPTGGAYWTTSNLYTTKDKAGVAFVGGARLNPGKYNTNNSAIVINSTGDFTGKTVAYGQAATSISTTTAAPMKDFAAKFGLSYTYAQAMLACPTNWHLPTDVDWGALADAHGGGNVAGAGMRANNDFYLTNDHATSLKWGLNDASGTILSGFNALPSGFVYSDGARAYSFSDYAYWWSATTSGSYRYMGYNSSSLLAHTNDTGHSFSVRCVKD